MRNRAGQKTILSIAFGRSLIALDDDLRVIISPRLKHEPMDAYQRDMVEQVEGKQLRLPVLDVSDSGEGTDTSRIVNSNHQLIGEVPLRHGKSHGMVRCWCLGMPVVTCYYVAVVTTCRVQPTPSRTPLY